MKFSVTTITQPAEGEIELTLHIGSLDPAMAQKATMLGQMIQGAAADGKFSFTEDLMIGMALAAMLSK